MFIAVGGAFGAIMRFLSQATIYELVGKSFPYGTLFVNVVGSFLMGLLSVVLIEKFNLSAQWHMAILVGVLGSFTTFSTFSIETLVLFEQGDLFKAFYVSLQCGQALFLPSRWFDILTPTPVFKTNR